MKRILSDPLLHFLLIGIVIFAVSYAVNPPAPDESNRIVIDGARIARLRENITLLQGRPATDEEVAAVVDSTVREEVLYREALVMGLDQDDTVIRNRMIEKMRFLTENVGDPPLPSDDQLRAYFAANAERFRLPASMTFEQVYFSPDVRGDRAPADAEAAVARLRARGTPSSPEALAAIGDPLPLWTRYEVMSTADISIAFGEDFLAGITGLQEGEWRAPVRSRYGWHAVRVLARAAARDPSLEEVRTQVETAYLDELRRTANEDRYRQMRERYEVVVEPETLPTAAEAAES